MKNYHRNIFLFISNNYMIILQQFNDYSRSILRTPMEYNYTTLRYSRTAVRFNRTTVRHDKLVSINQQNIQQQIENYSV